jgi:hypothetical protein
MWSRFAFDGWQGHYRRTNRWFERLVAVANNWAEYSLDEQVDFALVFFQGAYHLRDYLEREGAASKVELDQLMTSTPALRGCRDLCIGAKHREIDRPSVDSQPWILREYRGTDDWRLVVKVGDKFDLVSLASDCMRAWDGFLAANGLDTEGLSEPAAALMAAALRDQQARP